MKIYATQRLFANWFDSLSKEEKRKYVELHPDSKYAENYDAAKDKEPIDHGDAERIKDLKSQIRDLLQDVKEIEADGDDAGPEKKHLKSLQAELHGLQF